ncbi:MAG TPA: hypothetical protein VJG13_03345, partial [Thermoanaerobaculia bacterium]|nr:hypothetical protein [Thermoanaerobaculia bacterium]
ACPGRPPADMVGVGLSGGGIRSATFCLGFFQGLAARGGLIRQIDYLSSVSGGGYFGAFLGRLCNRDYVGDPEELDHLLVEDRTRDGLVGGIFRNLRENGRHLAPNGSGDLLLGGAVLFRNWVSIHVVLWSFVLMLFLLLQTARVAVEVAAARIGWDRASDLIAGAEGIAGSVWWSLFIVLPLVVFVLLAFPLGWAYWLVERGGRKILTALGEDERGRRHPGKGEEKPVRSWLPKVPLVVLGILAVLYLAWLRFGLDSPWSATLRAETFWLAVAVLVIVVLTPVYWWLAVKRVRTEMQGAGGEEGAHVAKDPKRRATQEVIFEDAAVRNLLSRQVKTALVVTGALLALAAIDSLGQTIYVLAVDETLTVTGWIGGILGGLTFLSGFARRIAVRFGGDSGKKRVGLSLGIVATVAALLVVAFLLVTLDAASHAVAWLGRAPAGVVSALAPPEEGELAARTRVPGARAVDVRIQMSARPPLDEEQEPAAPAARRAAGWALLPPALGFLAAGLLSLAFSRIWPFVNRSSHQALYSARLTRAYLGASNPERLGPGAKSVTQVLKGDDLSLEAYWPPPESNGFPLHLINVTVNETVDGQSQIQQRDRKGTGLALGPAGLSLGIRHHAVGPFGSEERPAALRVFPEGETDFRVFEYPAAGPAGEAAKPGDEIPSAALRTFRGEPLTLGNWVGISGAAFSTGLGSRTNLGLALLTGLANVRLGYWWDSGVDPETRQGVSPAQEPQGAEKVLAWMARTFKVQSYLLDELLARFPGTARPRWYLSDGGHFEVLGGYELIRRRLPLIVLLDAEADPDYTYGGLANLVRKARLDFGAEIDFMSPKEIDAELPPAIACHVGSLEQLRRGKWKRTGEDVDEGGKRRRPVADFESADRTGRCLVHAALARVRYEDRTESRLLYVKPSLFGDEPEDVLDYHRQHPDFPQETTADQFFDEAQWESYRRLGQHIAEKIFRDPDEAAADLVAAEKPRKVGGKKEPKGAHEARLARLWHLGRLDCPPRAVTNPKDPEATGR